MSAHAQAMNEYRNGEMLAEVERRPKVTEVKVSSPPLPASV